MPRIADPREWQVNGGKPLLSNCHSTTYDMSLAVTPAPAYHALPPFETDLPKRATGPGWKKQAAEGPSKIAM